MAAIEPPEHSAATAGRIGRPPKVDEHGTPTRERLLRAAVDACVEFGYEGQAAKITAQSLTTVAKRYAQGELAQTVV